MAVLFRIVRKKKSLKKQPPVFNLEQNLPTRRGLVGAGRIDEIYHLF